MPDRYRNPAGVSFVLLVALFGVRTASAAPASFGDIEIVPETEPRGDFLHGYAEYRFQVRNRSDDRAIRVTLQLPGESRGRGGREGGLSSITKTIEVAPSGVVSMSLLQPAAPAVGGDGVAVFIDGRKQEQILMVRAVFGASPPAQVMHGRRGRHPGYHGSSKGGARNEVNILTTLRVPEDFFQVPASSRFGERPFRGGPAGGMGGPPGMAVPPGAMGGPGGAAGGPLGVGGPGAMPGGPPGGVGRPVGNVPPFDAILQRSELPIVAWSGRWLAFTRYDGIFVTAEDLEDLRRAGAASRATLQALWQFVEAGGVLLVLGDGKTRVEVPVPAAYRNSPVETHGLLVYAVGFGRCILSPDRNPERWSPLGSDKILLCSLGRAAWGGSPSSLAHGLLAAYQFLTAVDLDGVGEGLIAPPSTDRWTVVHQAVNSTSSAWKNNRNFMDLNKEFAVVDNLGLPVKGLFGLMVLFGVAMGPANLMWLTRYKRRIWLLWTVPALSLFFCLAVLGYMVVAEGWQGHARVGGLTILDEKEKRATTLGRAAFYSPVTPGDGLHFTDFTEVQMLGEENAAWTNSCSIDWTNDQHLARGWVTARVPAFFALRKSETLRRERLVLRHEPDGGLSITNALGVDIRQLWLADDQGRLHRAAAVAAGGSARLEFDGTKVAPAIPLQEWRELYAGTTRAEWLTTTLQREPAKHLGPGTYIAFVESSPFLEQGLKNARVRPSESVVLGIMADPAGGR